ncbi:MAG: helix-hairpin-helix domain-containing protein, partial [Bacteroidota bacterium]|nr:helix-hairpin-helix domain-containing protein [Bacteroidota bacterium]
EGLGPKSIDKLIAAIDASRKQSLWRQIVSLGIPLVGPQTAKAIIKHFKISSLEEIALLTHNQLVEIHDVGEKVSQSIVDFANDSDSSQEIKELSTCFEYSNASSPESVSSELLASKRVVVTGSFDFASRNEIKDFVESHGGVVSGSVSKNTSVVFIGEKAGSKADKARALGIPMLGPQELLAWTQDNIIPSILKNEDNE